MAHAGITLVRTPVGDRYILERMMAEGFNLGGEQSGHLIFLDHNTTGDGLISGLQILSLMKRTGRALSDLANCMRQGLIHLCVVGADRIAANGDVANKIGTYSVAVLARAHNIPFYVAAPYSTIDLRTASGNDIPIEERRAEEVTSVFGIATIAPKGVAVLNPAFDVTPAEYVTAIITERGVFKPQELAQHFR